MSRRKALLSLLFAILLLAGILGLAYSPFPRDGSYYDTDVVQYEDTLFYPDKVSIPLQAKRQGGSLTIFKVEESLFALKERFERMSSPHITIKEEEQNYFIIEVHDNEGRISNAIVCEITNDLPDPMDGWHYYNIQGFYRSVLYENAYQGGLYWPCHFFSDYLELNYTPLNPGEEYETNATIDDFEAFYQKISNQYGVTFERKDNTLILSPGFFSKVYPLTGDDITTTLVFSEGKVRIEIEATLMAAS